MSSKQIQQTHQNNFIYFTNEVIRNICHVKSDKMTQISLFKFKFQFLFKFCTFSKCLPNLLKCFCLLHSIANIFFKVDCVVSKTKKKNDCRTFAFYIFILAFSASYKQKLQVNILDLAKN